MFHCIGFICPVHTPDGTPCGLLNHLSKDCIVTQPVDQSLMTILPSVLTSLGMLPLKMMVSTAVPHHSCYVLLLDGCVLGLVPKDSAPEFVKQLRLLKVDGKKVKFTKSCMYVYYYQSMFGWNSQNFFLGC